MSGRREVLDERRRLCEERFDTVHAPHYDELWGDVAGTHLDFVLGLGERLTDGASVLDAACGTGKYWSYLLELGLGVVGLDQSSGMLEKAREKFPALEVVKCSLEELPVREDLHGRFDGLLCVDAMEYIGPEDWPLVLSGFSLALRRGGLAYVSVDLPDPTAQAGTGAAADGALVEGERIVDDGSCRFSPTAQQVDRWFGEAGFEILADAEGDGYRHVIVVR